MINRQGKKTTPTPTHCHGVQGIWQKRKDLPVDLEILDLVERGRLCFS